MPSLSATVAATLVVAGMASAQDQALPCASGLQVILSRGTTEEGTTGVMGDLGQKLAGRINGTQVYGLPYPATFDNPGYLQSVMNGTTMLRATITAYVLACPDTKLAVLGYSQGAQITSNNFCGASDVWLGGLDPFDKEDVEKNVVAVALFGDPTHKANDTFSRGTAVGDGFMFRDSNSACEALGDRIVSFCDEGDPFCDVRSDLDLEVHTSYMERYEDEVVDWIVERCENGSGSFPGGDNSTSSDDANGEESVEEREENEEESEPDVPDSAPGLVPALAMAVILPLVSLFLV